MDNEFTIYWPISLLLLDVFPCLVFLVFIYSSIPNGSIQLLVQAMWSKPYLSTRPCIIWSSGTRGWKFPQSEDLPPPPHSQTKYAFLSVLVAICPHPNSGYCHRLVPPPTSLSKSWYRLSSSDPLAPLSQGPNFLSSRPSQVLIDRDSYPPRQTGKKQDGVELTSSIRSFAVGVRWANSPISGCAPPPPPQLPASQNVFLWLSPPPLHI